MKSELPSAQTVSGAELFASRTTKDLLLRSFRWMVTTIWFLFLLAGILVVGSLLLSIFTDAWHWFQRSGALMVSVGAILSTQRPLRLLFGSMIGDDSSQDCQTDNRSDRIPQSELRTCICGFVLVAMGTLIWSYGDLLGCLAHWNMECLP